MNSIVEFGNAVTMTSLELVDFINTHRKQQAEQAGAEFPSKDFAKVEHADFMKKVLKVFKVRDVVAGKFSSYYIASNGKTNPCYRFPKREACLMAMSYSYELQAAVFDHMTALEDRLKQGVSAQLPQTYIEALEHLLEAKKAEQAAIAERDHAIATKAQIGSKREATAMAKASSAAREVARLKEELGRNAKHATVIAVERALGEKLPKNAYVPMRKWCRSLGVEPSEVVDERYGTVKAWPAGAWLAAHGIDIASLFESSHGV